MTPSLTLPVINTWPDHQCSIGLLEWLDDCGFPRPIKTRYGGRDWCCGTNMMIRLALESEYEHFVFAERDVFPTLKDTAPFLENDTIDLLCAKAENGKAWQTPDAFHCNLWRASAPVLQAIGLPAFRWPTNADGTELRGCPCSTFAAKARKLGFSTGYAGSVGHTPRVNDGMKDIILPREPR